MGHGVYALVVPSPGSETVGNGRWVRSISLVFLGRKTKEIGLTKATVKS